MLNKTLDVAGWVANCLAGLCIDEVVPVEIHCAGSTVLLQPFPVVSRHHFGILPPLLLEGAPRAIRTELGVPEALGILEVTSALITVEGFPRHG